MNMFRWRLKLLTSWTKKLSIFLAVRSEVKRARIEIKGSKIKENGTNLGKVSTVRSPGQAQAQ